MTTPDHGKVEERAEKGGDCSLNLRLRPDSVTWGEMDVSCTGQNNLHDLNCTSPLCNLHAGAAAASRAGAICHTAMEIDTICIFDGLDLVSKEIIENNFNDKKEIKANI